MLTYWCILVVTDMVLLLLRVLNHHNFQAQYILFGVDVFLFHMSKNILTNQTKDQVFLGNLVDLCILFHLPVVLNNLQDHCTFCDVDVLLHHMLQNMMTMKTMMTILIMLTILTIMRNTASISLNWKLEVI